MQDTLDVAGGAERLLDEKVRHEIDEELLQIPRISAGLIDLPISISARAVSRVAKMVDGLEADVVERCAVRQLLSWSFGRDKDVEVGGDTDDLEDGEEADQDIVAFQDLGGGLDAYFSGDAGGDPEEDEIDGRGRDDAVIVEL